MRSGMLKALRDSNFNSNLLLGILYLILFFKTFLHNADFSSQPILLIPTPYERMSFLSLPFLFPLTAVIIVAPCQGKRGEKIKSEIQMAVCITGGFASCCVSKMSLN